MRRFPEYKLTKVVSVVSHQLKTPLAVIKGYLEVLLSEDLGQLNSGQRDYLADALKNTVRMMDLVKNLLDISRIEEGRMEFQVEPSSLEAIVKEAIEEFSPLLKAKNAAITFKAVGKIPLLKIDCLRIKQVVSNIISNAAEYNEKKGEIEVVVQRKGDRVVFSCQDNGIGIPLAEQKKIFSKFHRSEQAITLSTGGSGLGLFISKAIIERSGGKIWFKSKKGAGSTFYFSLPIKPKKYGKK